MDISTDLEATFKKVPLPETEVIWDGDNNPPLQFSPQFSDANLTALISRLRGLWADPEFWIAIRSKGSTPHSLNIFYERYKLPVKAAPSPRVWIRAVNNARQRRQTFKELIFGNPDNAEDHCSELPPIFSSPEKIAELLHKVSSARSLGEDYRVEIAVVNLPPAELTTLCKILKRFLSDAGWCLKHPGKLPCELPKIRSKGRLWSKERIDATENLVERS